MKRKLLLAACAFMGISAAWADTSLLKSEDGWEKITTISQNDIASNYYVFVANDADLMLGLAESSNQGNKAAFFQTSVDPATSLNKVWYLEANGENYAMRNVEYTYLQLQTEWGTGTSDNRWRTNDQPYSCGWTGLGLSYDDGAWALTSTQYNQPLGIYDNAEGTPTEGQELGANDAGKGQKFQIYAIAKKDFIANYIENNGTSNNPVDVSSFIINPDFGLNSNLGWSSTGKAENQQWGQGTMESWNNSNVTVTQTLPSVPNGIYKLSLDMISDNDRPKNAYVYAKGDVEFVGGKVSESVSGGYDTMSSNVAGKTVSADIVVVTNNELTIGFRDPSSGDGWVVVDNFKLEYLGNSIELFKSEYEKALAAANEVDENKLMNKDVQADFADAKANYSSVSEETIAAYAAALNALLSTTPKAANSIEAYANSGINIPEYVNAMKSVESELSNTNVYTEESYKKWYSDVQAYYDNGEFTDEEVVTLNAASAYSNGWHATNHLDEILLSTWTIGGEQAKDYETSLNINVWSAEGDNDGSNFKVPFFEYWGDDDKSLAKTVIESNLTGLPAGAYEISAWIRVRAKNGTAATDATGITLSVNGGKSIDVTEGNAVAGTQFNLAEYKARTRISDDGKLTITFDVADGNNISWLSFKNVKYDTFEDASESEYEALNKAISEIEGNLGFEEGEYAPYENIENMKVLAAAKDVYEAVSSSDEVQEAINKLNELEWTANDTEVNAVYNPTFALSENNMTAIGWISDDGSEIGNENGEYHSRAMVNDDRLNVFNDTKSALYLRFDNTNSKFTTVYNYGSVVGYTMPLKVAKYNVKAQVGIWTTDQSQWNKDLRIAIAKKSDGTEVGGLTLKTPSSSISANATDLIDFDFIVEVSEADDYIFTVDNMVNSSTAIVISNIEIKKAVNETITISEAGYATFSSKYPLDLSQIEDGTAYIVADDAEGEYIKLTEQTDAVPANTGLIIAGEGTVTIPVAATGVAPETNYLVGVNKDTEIESGYVLGWKEGDKESVGFYVVDEAPATVKAGQAYLSFPAAEEEPESYAKVLRFVFGDGTATAVEAIEVAEADADGAVYNVAGQQVGKDYKGIVIKNGKKYLNK